MTDNRKGLGELAPVTGDPPYVVMTESAGTPFYLCGTIWTWDRNRAMNFGLAGAAQAAIDKAARFNPKPPRAARIVPANEGAQAND